MLLGTEVVEAADCVAGAADAVETIIAIASVTDNDAIAIRVRAAFNPMSSP